MRIAAVGAPSVGKTAARTAFCLLWLIVVVASVGRFARLTWTRTISAHNPLALPPLVSLKPEIVNILTLGHRGLYDDFIDIWALQILTNPEIRTLDADTVARSIRAITAQQPKLETLYMFACFVLDSDFHRPDLCQPISMDGLKAFPHSWRIPMTQGFMHAFRLHQPAEAAVFFSLAASREDSPPYVADLVKKLLKSSELNEDDLKKSLNLIMTAPGGQDMGIAPLLEGALHKEGTRHAQP